MACPLVSAIIPTYNRRNDVVRAVCSVATQTYPVDRIEIIVVDDGGTDDTCELLTRCLGDRVRILRKSNGGVSSARNLGLAAARGEYLAFLDSDDEWGPTKIEKQIAFLAARPRFGMVLTDVEEIDEARVAFGIYRRRPHIKEDGHVLSWVLRTPALVPPSALLRRAVYEDVGGFDENLPTASDLDFHLRVARRWPIGVIEEPLTRARRSDKGLSTLPRSYEDQFFVVQRFLDRHAGEISPRDRDAALLATTVRLARGLLLRRELGAAFRHGADGARYARDGGDALRLAMFARDYVKTLAAQRHTIWRARRPGPSDPT
jgi:glycosyltransferase involved in cell wall biosynthesis